MDHPEGSPEEEQQSQAAYQPSDLILLAIWVGLMAGLAEASILGYRKVFLGHILQESFDVYWMAPAGNVLLYAMPGIGLAILARWWHPSRLPFHIPAFGSAFLGFFSILLLFGQVTKWAALVLAAGLAVQAARMMAANPGRVMRLVRRSLPFLSLAIVILLAIIRGGKAFQERRDLASLPPPVPSAPNILLIVIDTARAESFSLYGNERPTSPQLEELANRGVQFERAIAPSPWTLPSHASMFTGQYPNLLSADWSVPFDDPYPTLAETLAAQGYATAGFVANFIYTTYEHGLDRGFSHYQDYDINLGQIILSTSLGRFFTSSDKLRNLTDYHELLNRKRAGEVNAEFQRWLASQPRRPYFAFLNYFDAHEPYLPPAPFDTMFGPPRGPEVEFYHLAHFAARRNKPAMTAADIEIERSAYEGAIAYVDQQIGVLMDELERKGELRNTMVIITSDHGEHFGEHGLFEHGVSLYRPLLHVPLLVIYPHSVPGGLQVAQPVTLQELPITILDLIGLAGEGPFPGKSIARYWQGTSDQDDSASSIYAEVRYLSGRPQWFPVSKGDMRTILAEGLQYILNGDGSEELYDFYQDVREENNLADVPEYFEAKARLREALFGFQTAGQNARSPQTR